MYCQLSYLRIPLTFTTGFYLLSKYIGQWLGQVHEGVPYFNEKILLSVERTLKRFKPTEPFERTSWTITDDRDIHYRAYKTFPVMTRRSHPRLDQMVKTETLSAHIHPRDLWLRMDHQTFRKLPLRSNGIAFGVCVPFPVLAVYAAHHVCRHVVQKRVEGLAEMPPVLALVEKHYTDGDHRLMHVHSYSFYKINDTQDDLTQARLGLQGQTHSVSARADTA